MTIRRAARSAMPRDVIAREWALGASNHLATGALSSFQTGDVAAAGRPRGWSNVSGTWAPYCSAVTVSVDVLFACTSSMLTLSAVGTPSMVDTASQRSTFQSAPAGSKYRRSVGRDESAATA